MVKRYVGFTRWKLAAQVSPFALLLVSAPAMGSSFLKAEVSHEVHACKTVYRNEPALGGIVGMFLGDIFQKLVPVGEKCGVLPQGMHGSYSPATEQHSSCFYPDDDIDDAGGCWHLLQSKLLFVDGIPTKEPEFAICTSFNGSIDLLPVDAANVVGTDGQRIYPVCHTPSRDELNDPKIVEMILSSIYQGNTEYKVLLPLLTEENRVRKSAVQRLEELMGPIDKNRRQ